MTFLPVTSQFGAHQTVYIDPWGTNPLLEDAQQSVPQLVGIATRSNGEPPTMFESGDLPPFTASGIDPAFLAMLPWKIRHAGATAPSTLDVLNWVETYGHDGDGVLPTPGLNEYIARFRGWLSGSWTNPAFTGANPDDQGAADDDMYDSLFSQVDAAASAKRAAINAAAQDFNDRKNRTGPYGA